METQGKRHSSSQALIDLFHGFIIIFRNYLANNKTFKPTTKPHNELHLPRDFVFSKEVGKECQGIDVGCSTEQRENLLTSIAVYTCKNISKYKVTASLTIHHMIRAGLMR